MLHTFTSMFCWSFLSIYSNFVPLQIQSLYKTLYIYFLILKMKPLMISEHLLRKVIKPRCNRGRTLSRIVMCYAASGTVCVRRRSSLRLTRTHDLPVSKRTFYHWAKMYRDRFWNDVCFQNTISIFMDRFLSFLHVNITCMFCYGGCYLAHIENIFYWFLINNL